MMCFQILAEQHCLHQSHGVRLENNRIKSNDIRREMRYNLLVTRDNKMTVRSNPKNVTVHFFHSVKISETIIRFLLVEDEIAFF